MGTSGEGPADGQTVVLAGGGGDREGGYGYGPPCRTRLRPRNALRDNLQRQRDSGRSSWGEKGLKPGVGQFRGRAVVGKTPAAAPAPTCTTKVRGLLLSP